MHDKAFPWKWIYTTGGLGLLPGAPGTYASMACVGLWYFTPETQIRFLPYVLVFIAIVGVISSEKAVKETGISDPSCVVIDEWVGQGITLLAVPHTFLGGGIALVIFRIFDILKPPPVRWLEKIPGGLGIMLDDMGAGIMGYLLIQSIWLVASQT